MADSSIKPPESHDWIISSSLNSQRKPFLLLLSSLSAFPPLPSRSPYRKPQQNDTTSTSSTGWASLPSDLLLSISQRLMIPDCIRLSSVCTSWASPPLKHFLLTSPHFPWLVMTQREEPDSKLFIQSLRENRSYRIPFLDPESHRHTKDFVCAGYRDGWFIIICRTLEVYLLNPITGEKIHLPSFNTIHKTKKVIYFYRIGKVALSPLPSADRGFTAVVIYKESYLAFARAGDVVWTKLYFGIDEPTHGSIKDIVYHDGKFFVICSYGRVLAFDLAGPAPKKFEFVDPVINRISYFCARYLVTSPSGDLLQVVASRSLSYHRESLRFVVLEFVPEMDSCWFEIKDLGDIALFMDERNCMAFSSKNIPGLRGNCIYYAYKKFDNLGHVCVFDIERRVIKPLFPPNFYFGPLDSFPLIWFMPSLS